jgi:hypothetical protein
MLHTITHNRLANRHLLSRVAAAILLISHSQTVALADPPPLPRTELVSQSKTAPAKPPVRVTISKETTYITEPLREDGYPDYLRYLNETMSQGVTPENNAAVPLARATGFLELEGVLREQYFKLLGIEPPSEKGDYFQPWPEFAAEIPIAEQPPKPLADTRPQGEYFEQLAKKPWTQPLSSEELRHVTNWIDANDHHLDSIVAASKLDRFFSPLIVSTSDLDHPILIEAFLPDAYPTREAAKALQCRAMLRMARREFDAAAEDLLAANRLANLISTKPMALYVVLAKGIECDARQAAIQLCARAGWSRKKISEFCARWYAFPATKAIGQAFDLGERLSFLDAACYCAREGWWAMREIIALIADLSGDKEPKPRGEPNRLMARATAPWTWLVKWDHVLKLGNEWHDRLVRIANITDRQQQAAELKRFDQDLKKLHRDIKQLPTRTGFYFYPRTFPTDLTSKALVGVMLPALNAIVHVGHDLETHRSMFDVSMALEQYRADVSTYPDRLNKLVPGFLVQISHDDFTRAEFIYQRTNDGYVLYSLGKNGRDDGGKTANDQDEADDIVVHVHAVKGPASR